MTAVAPALRSIYPPLVEAFGGYFTLADGRRLLDLSSQTMNMLLGQNCQALPGLCSTKQHPRNSHHRGSAHEHLLISANGLRAWRLRALM